MKKYLLGFLIFLFCANSYALDKTPKRIISLGPFITESICALGLQDNLVGVTSYCLRPEYVQEKEKIGSVVEVNLESIVSLKPDIVLASPLSDDKAKTKIKQMGIKLVEFPQVNTFEAICSQMIELGEALNRKEQAVIIVENSKKIVNNITKALDKTRRKKVFVQIGSKPLTTVNKDYFINDIIKKAGAINIAENAPGVMYSLEKIVESNPDVIIITTMGITGEQEKEFWQKFKTVNAVKNNDIYIVDSYYFCSPTPSNFIEALKILNKLLYKESINEKS